MAKVAEEYFQEMFSSSPTISLEDCLPTIQPKVTMEMNAKLIAPVTDEEIFEAMKQIGADRAPGPDGFTAAFYHQFWQTIGTDVSRMVRCFFETGQMENGINHTNIRLIPKFTEASNMSDYRPISLCSVAYKLISKVLGLRLQSCLAAVISETQAAFVPGRQIFDNILVAHELVHALKAKKHCSENYMAIKTDISKAYDRVEWGFLQDIMCKLGIHPICISWIMTCVTSVTYSVLINGKPYGEIKPERGIRQGDTLSPYLFLLCSEALSQMVEQAQHQNELQGMKLARHCPSVSHLFFADDSLFFCRANEENAKCMAGVLDKYEKASGQMVNLQKSSIIFGKRVNIQQRDCIQNALNIYTIGGGGKYLGLPEQFGRSKVHEFEGLVQNIKSVTLSWHNQSLSQAGKEIFIKSVLQAKPVYPMSCFLLPKTTCDEINSVLSEFWWGKGEERRKISWVSWKRLSLPKKEGGMGFRDLYSFNKALLAKQAWRILNNPNSLISRIYRGRYHYSTTFLQSSNPKHASYGYKSIQVGKDLLKQGLRVMIGNGRDTNVWFDHWLPVTPPRKVVQVNYNRNMKVEEFIDEETASWKIHKLEEFLQPLDIAQVLKIKLSKYAAEDKLIWPFTKDQQYNVRSGYWVATHYYNEGEDIARPEGSLELKQGIWRLNILPKIKQFLWRVVTDAIPTATRLCMKGINIDPICQRCCQEDETINHILFICPHALAVWRCSGILLSHVFSNSLEENMETLFSFMNSVPEYERNKMIGFWNIWLIWKSRNEFLFQKRNVHPIEDARRASEANMEWFRNVILVEKGRTTKVVKSSKWEPPPKDWLKCNFDYSASSGNDMGGCGWILRDEKGRFLAASCVQIDKAQTSLEGETISFLLALQQIWIRGWKRVWFEGDNQELCGIINQVKEHIELGNLLCDVRYWMQRLPECSLEYVNRERNQAADALARQALIQSSAMIFFHSPPIWLIKLLYYPFTV